jgi:hypothetical protein
MGLIHKSGKRLAPGRKRPPKHTVYQ